MTTSIAVLRSREMHGLVSLDDRPTTPLGCLLGIALLADSAPSSTHHHDRGQRLVTASLSLHWVARTRDRAAPASGRVLRAAGSWPYLVSTGRILSADGVQIASSRSTFVGLAVSSAPPMVNGELAINEGPSLDVVAEDLTRRLEVGMHRDSGSTVRSRLEIPAVLRNRFGPLHGASAFTSMCIMGLQPDIARESPGVIIDSHVRFLRPITDDAIILTVANVRTSGRVNDRHCAILTEHGSELAIGHFVVARSHTLDGSARRA